MLLRLLLDLLDSFAPTWCEQNHGTCCDSDLNVFFPHVQLYKSNNKNPWILQITCCTLSFSHSKSHLHKSRSFSGFFAPTRPKPASAAEEGGPRPQSPGRAAGHGRRGVGAGQRGGAGGGACRGGGRVGERDRGVL